MIDPTTETVVARLAVATIADLDEALASTATGFRTWQAMSAHDRSVLMRRAAEIFRSEHAPDLTSVIPHWGVGEGKPRLLVEPTPVHEQRQVFAVGGLTGHG